MKNHNCITILLGGKFKEAKKFIVVVEIANGIFYDGLSRGA